MTPPGQSDALQRDFQTAIPPEQAARQWSRFDRTCQILLGIDGAEFIRRWDAGRYRSHLDRLRLGKQAGDPVYKCSLLAPPPEACPAQYAAARARR